MMIQIVRASMDSMTMTLDFKFEVLLVLLNTVHSHYDFLV